MSAMIFDHRCHLGRRVTRKILTMTRKTINQLHPSHSMAVVTLRKGERFSLSPLADYRNPVASRVARTLQRVSAASNQLFGFHVVCAECDGFIVRNERVRNCPHQTYSWSSMSEVGRREGEEAADGFRARGKYEGEVNGQLTVPGVLHPDPAFDRRGHGAIRRGKDGGKPSILAASDPSHYLTVNACDNADIILCTGHAARGSRPRRMAATRRKPTLNEDTHTEVEHAVYNGVATPETIMQGWREWSDRWEQMIRDEPETEKSADSDVEDQPYRDLDTLMQEWRDWSETWERSLKSR